MKLYSYFLLAALAVTCKAAAIPSTLLRCEELMIPLDVSAKNFALPSNLSVSDISLAYLKSLGDRPNAEVKGKYSIGARYCEPTKQVPGRRETLQILVHGFTYTRDYWSGLAAPGTRGGQDKYSWILYAAEQGYPTLSIDRLCNGLSSHPDGISACQLPLQAETVHSLIVMARSRTLPGLSENRKFNKIVLVGHSFGSLLANNLVAARPNDVEAMILTGFSFNITNGFAEVADFNYQEASKVDPVRFGSLGPSYLMDTNETAVKSVFYFGRFSQSFVDYDFAHRGTNTIGEYASLLIGQIPAPSYRGKLLVLDGEEDAAFCDLKPGPPGVVGPANCSAGFARTVERFFPASSDFEFSSTPETGHCLNLHLTAQQSYLTAHRYLAKVGF